MKKLLLLCVAMLMLNEMALARGVAALQQRALNRAAQALAAQQIAWLSMPRAFRVERNAMHAALFRMTELSQEQMPDQKKTERDSTSPDDPDSGKPAWEGKKPSRSGPGSAAYQPRREEGSAAYRDDHNRKSGRALFDG